MDSQTIADLARQILDVEDGALTPHEKEVIERAAKRLAVSRNINLEYERGATPGQRLADRVTEIGGSWGFIIAFAAVVVGWVAVNSVLIAEHPFDPYPYILLNLMLSMLASIQAPIILMSQNRAAARDRLVAAHDYEVNLKAELEILNLHSKVDQLRDRQMVELIRSQEEQIRLLTILVARREGG